MPTESEIPMEGTGERSEKQLCVSCMFPNEPEVHFCAKCGAPSTSYAATGPFESVFAEGHVYRQASERPRSLVVVFGIWMIFGVIGVTGIFLIAFSADRNFTMLTVGALMIAFALVMVVKTTRNYFFGKKHDAKHDE